MLQGVISNYDTDLFIPLIKRAPITELSTEHEWQGSRTGVSPVQASEARSPAALTVQHPSE